jgi:hypothetical protein
MPHADDSTSPDFTLIYEGEFDIPITGATAYRWTLYQDGEHMTRRLDANKPHLIRQIMTMANTRISLDTGHEVADWQPFTDQDGREGYRAVLAAGGA